MIRTANTLPQYLFFPNGLICAKRDCKSTRKKKRLNEMVGGTLWKSQKRKKEEKGDRKEERKARFV